jgi:predicted ATPase
MLCVLRGGTKADYGICCRPHLDRRHARGTQPVVRRPISDGASGTAPYLDDSARKALETLLMAGKSQPRQRLKHNTQTQIARALVNAFLSLALTRPTLLLIEDLHWIDSESRHFLKLLARANPRQPLCILLTGRPESSSLAAEIAESVIHLQPLSRSHMEALGRQLWDQNRPSTVLTRAIDRAEGVPFILEELLRSADATDAPHGQSLPQSVESVIRARLQRLSPRVKTFAQVLSLLGEEVEIHLATAVLNSPQVLRLVDPKRPHVPVAVRPTIAIDQFPFASRPL